MSKSKPPKKRPTRPPTPRGIRSDGVDDGVDYGPAYAALADLASWAFGLAAVDVEDWPEAARRVRGARRYVLDRLDHKRPRATPSDDILFTAGLLARIFEADIGLGMTEMVSILDRLGLPTEVVPMPPRGPAPVANVIPLRPRQVRVAAPPCIECSRSPYRNAA